MLHLKLIMKQQALLVPSLLIFLLAIHDAQAVDRRKNTNNSNFQTSHQSNHHQSNQNNHEISDKENLDQDSNQDSPASSGGNNFEHGGIPDSTESSNFLQPPHELEIVRLNDTSVVLKWDIPPNALDHLQFFKIQYKSTRKGSDWKTDNREIPPQIRAYQINGLRPGNYFFIVSAVYDNDDNASSDQFKYRLRAKSKISADEMPEQRAPKIFWSEAESDFFRFKWSYQPKDKDVPYFGYLVYYRSAHAVTDFTIYNTLDENVEIAELEPETPFEAKVVAYNQHGVSEFSETIHIKTKPKSANSTTPTSLSSSTTPSASSSVKITTTMPSATTRKPAVVDSSITESSMHNISSSPPVVPTTAPAAIETTSQPSNGPTTSGNHTITTVTATTSTANHNTSSTNPIYQWLSRMIELIFGSVQSDTTLAIRHSLFVLLPIIFIVSASICLISCHQRRKDSPPSSTHDSMQFGLEINGYFKNSFPGVEKEYSPMANHHAHHGFVNNHPHINDFG